MKGKKQQNNKLLSIVIILFAFVGMIALLVNALYIPTKTYHSDFLKVTFEYPERFKIKERFTDIVLEDPKGKITISRTGTNFEKLNDHVITLSKLNNFIIVDKQEVIINGYPAIKGFINKEKYYFIYPVDWTVFSLSANSPNLFYEIDRIAKSFRYAP